MQKPIFKLYLGDIGLLSAQTRLDAKIYIDNDTKTFTHYNVGRAICVAGAYGY
jgi:hypothetical protein